MRFLSVCLSLAAFPATAACVPDAGTVLSCTARGGSKALDVCLQGTDILYTYGPYGGAPELSLRRSVAEIEHQPWNGIGRSIWESTTFRNGGYAYEVYISVDRMLENTPSFSGVTVYRDGAEIASVECDAGSDDISLWAVSDAKQALGICWDLSVHAWGRCE